jgi:hypothetical protein
MEALQIQHKLVFDVINEELLLARTRHHLVLQQLRSAREALAAGGGTGAAATVAGIALLEGHLLASVRSRLQGTLRGMASNLEAAVAVGGEGRGAAAAGARAAALARADVRTGFLGDELEDLQEEEALISQLVADDLAQELQREVLEDLAREQQQVAQGGEAREEEGGVN